MEEDSRTCASAWLGRKTAVAHAADKTMMREKTKVGKKDRSCFIFQLLEFALKNRRIVELQRRPSALKDPSASPLFCGYQDEFAQKITLLAPQTASYLPAD